MRLRSQQFDAGEPIPHGCTYLGANLSPALLWSDAPAQTRSFALVCVDPDAPRRPWFHWLIYRIPPGRSRLPEGIPRAEHVPGIGLQGRNDFGAIGYGGPLPPTGRTHRYVFTLFALGRDVPLPSGLTAHQLEAATARHVVARAEIMGRYGRAS